MKTLTFLKYGTAAMFGTAVYLQTDSLMTDLFVFLGTIWFLSAIEMMLKGDFDSKLVD